ESFSLAHELQRRTHHRSCRSCPKIRGSRRDRRYLLQCPPRRDTRDNGRQRLWQEHATSTYDWFDETNFRLGENLWRRAHNHERTGNRMCPASFWHAIPVRRTARLTNRRRKCCAATFSAH